MQKNLITHIYIAIIKGPVYIFFKVDLHKYLYHSFVQSVFLNILISMFSSLW